MKKVSVIIPIYKVENFIERCVRSLFEQTLKDEVEFIFVDDASPDHSVSIIHQCLDDYPERKNQTQILVHSQNQGLPSARNTGLQAAGGKYIFHCDSDDYLDSGALEQMYEAAEQNQADMVWCDWYLSFAHSERYMKQPKYDSPVEALKGMLGGAMKYNVWNKLVIRRLYTDNLIMFPDGHGMGEDMTMIRLAACAKRVCYLPQAFYHYVRQNEHGFTQVRQQAGINYRHLEDLKWNVERTANFVARKWGSQVEKELAFFKLEAKFPFLISGDSQRYALWQSWFPEANPYILQNHYISFRSRMLQYWASKKQFWMVRLYYHILMKLVYGVLYK